MKALQLTASKSSPDLIQADVPLRVPGDGVEPCSDPRVNQAFFIIEPNQKQLVEIGRLLDKGQLQTVVFSGTLPRNCRGKVVGAVQNVTSAERIRA
jgi:hypothetical protein